MLSITGSNTGLDSKKIVLCTTTGEGSFQNGEIARSRNSTGDGRDEIILNFNGCHTRFYAMLSTLTSPSVSVVEAQLHTMSPFC